MIKLQLLGRSATLAHRAFPLLFLPLGEHILIPALAEFPSEETAARDRTVTAAARNGVSLEMRDGESRTALQTLPLNIIVAGGTPTSLRAELAVSLRDLVRLGIEALSAMGAIDKLALVAEVPSGACARASKSGPLRNVARWLVELGSADHTNSTDA